LVPILFDTEPSDALSLDPHAHLHKPVLVSITTDTILFVLQPAAYVVSSVRPCVGTMTTFHIILELAIVLAAICPVKHTFTMLFISLPLTIIYFTFRTHVLSLPINLVILECTFVPTTIFPSVNTMAMFSILEPVPYIHGLIVGVDEATTTTLLVLFPPAFVD